MESLVLRMQRQAMDSSTSVDDLVRTALVVATKLNVPELRDWCELELRGYAEREVPAYRRVQGQLRAWNPVHRTFIPVLSRDAATTKALTTRAAVQPIAQLERVYRNSGDSGTLEMPLSPEVISEVFADTPAYQMGIVPTLLLAPTQVFSILDAVRNTVLEWSLRLERDGFSGREWLSLRVRNSGLARPHTT